MSWKNRIGHWALTAAVAGTALLILTALGPTLAGRKTFIVLGGSMEPSIRAGAVVVAEVVPPTTLQAGDVITYVARSNQVMTHRIVEVTEDPVGLGFETRGDANTVPDAEPVRPVNVLGRVWYSVPLAGYLLHFGNQPATKLAMVALGILVVVGSLLRGSAQCPSDGRVGPAAEELVGRGQGLARAGQRSEAHRAFQAALVVDPRNPEAWLWRAGTAETPAEALRCLEQVLRLDPGDVRARRGLEAVRADIARSRGAPPVPA